MVWSLQEVAQHDNEKSCWIIINNQVYDVTEFLAEHPGGSSAILRYAGRDATVAYEPIHPKDAIQRNLPASKHLGPVDSSAIPTLAEKRKLKKTKDELRVEKALRQRPPLHRILNLRDMEDVAKQVLSYKAWSYYSSAADDEITLQENARAFSRFFFRARVLRPMSKCDPSTVILGFKSSLPIFVSGAALAKLGHPLGEVNITKGAGASGLIQMVSTNASVTYAEISSAASSDQVLFFQLYKHKDDKEAEKLIREVEQLGYKSIWLTVDVVVPGNRERDLRSSWILEDEENGKKMYSDGEGYADEMENSGGAAGFAIRANDDRDMTWEKTIPWLRSITKLPIVIKGIQCVEDAVLAAEAGVDGILLSNHGGTLKLVMARSESKELMVFNVGQGRQLEYSLPPIEVLHKLRLQRPDVFDRLEVYIDGGARRGTDVLKALCLGAKAVGMGRPFLCAQSAYGEAGVLKVINILEHEITTAMRLVGAATIADLTSEMVEHIDWQPRTHTKL